jgi:hypothetical protein
MKKKKHTKKREFSFPNGKIISMFKAVIWLPAFYPTAPLKVKKKLFSFKSK